MWRPSKEGLLCSFNKIGQSFQLHLHLERNLHRVVNLRNLFHYKYEQYYSFSDMLTKWAECWFHLESSSWCWDMSSLEIMSTSKEFVCERNMSCILFYVENSSCWMSYVGVFWCQSQILVWWQVKLHSHFATQFPKSAIQRFSMLLPPPHPHIHTKTEHEMILKD